MDINYSNKVIDLLEENKRFLANKNKAIPVENKTLNKESIELDNSTENINAKIKKDSSSKIEDIISSKLDPYKETIDLNLKYVSQSKTEKSITNLELIPTLSKARIPTQNTDEISNPLNTGIAVLDGIGDGLTGAINSLNDYTNQISNGFSNSSSPQGLIDNYALYEKKSDIKKSVDFSTINAIPYVIDDTIKQFQSGSALNSIVSGIIGTVSTIDELVGSFYDAEEVLELATVNYNQIANGGKLFSGDGIFGYNPTIGGSRPQIKIKKKTKDGKNYETEQFGVPDIKYLNSRENIGFLYVRPFMNKIPAYPFNIPFQTNPKINEDTIQANYAAEQFLNRVGDIKTFINTSAQTLSLETNYIILNDDMDSESFATSYKRNNVQYSNWMDKWTPSYIQSIENAYRSLVYSTFYQNINEAGINETKFWGVLKPPTVRIIMSSDGTATFSNELYSYPKARWVYDSSSDSFSFNESTEEKYKNTLKRLKEDSTLGIEYKWHKTFVITGVQISREDDSHINRNTNGTYSYNGFKVNITLAEVTENYLDCIPDFASYYNSFIGSLDLNHTIATPENNSDQVNFNTTTSNVFNTIDTSNEYNFSTVSTTEVI